eukprot:scaffold79700_cov45-Cyclotella_meneghiniana.AAC.2
MIDPATSWFEVVELPVLERPDEGTPKDDKSKKGKKTDGKDPYFDKSSAMTAKLGSEFKLHFQSLFDSFGLKRKPTSVKNPQANTILERIHQTLANMMHTATYELDTADSVSPNYIADFLNDAAWAVRSTYRTVLKASPGAAIFGRDMFVRCTFPR